MAASGKRAFVLGYTGAVGKEVVKALVERDFSEVVLIGRRRVYYDEAKLQKLVSYFLGSGKLKFQLILSKYGSSQFN